MNFGNKLRKLREKMGLTQQELAEKLGYVTNSYVSDVESGRFVPSEEKLRKIAKALSIPFKELDDLLMEYKLEQLGIKEPELISLFQEIPKLPEEDKRAIISAYIRIRERRQKKKIMRRIIEKAKELHEKYGSEDLYSLVEKLGAEIIEHPLGMIIKETYFKDSGVIVIDPSLHPYKKRHRIAHGLAHHLFHRKRKVNYFIDQSDFLKNPKVRKQEREAEVFAAHFLILVDRSVHTTSRRSLPHVLTIHAVLSRNSSRFLTSQFYAKQLQCLRLKTVASEFVSTR